MRNIGSCGLDSVRVIKDLVHINTNPKPWDIAAQFLFAKELNLKMTQLNGEPLDFAKWPIISNHGCYKDILTIINRNGGYHI